MSQRSNSPQLLRLTPLAACLAVTLSLGSANAVATDIAHVSQKTTTHSEQGQYGRNLKARRGETSPERVRAHGEKLRARNITSTPNRPAGTIAVTSCADDGSAGTLRSVVSSAVSGDTVDLSALTCSTITLLTGGVFIDVDDLTISGPGASALSIDGNGDGTVFDHFAPSNSGTLSIQGLTVTNGYYSGYPGGGIWSAGNVSLSDSAVTNSLATGAYAGGGGVYTAGNLTLSNSIISGNQAIAEKYDARGGGALVIGDVTLSFSTIDDNFVAGGTGGNGPTGTLPNSPGFGGGIFVEGNTTIINSTISNNRADTGGGLSNQTDGTTFTATNTTISGNSATEFAGGATFYSKAIIKNSTVTGNTGADGGGIFALGYASYGPSELQSTIISGNTSTGGSSYYGADFGMYEDSVIGANNLIGGADGVTIPADTISGNPLLAALANNGGPTRTHALNVGSPAIDMGNNTESLSFDQRGAGFARTNGAGTDIGAYETTGTPVDPQPVDAVALPALSTWALALMASLLGLLGWRRGDIRMCN